MNQQGSGSKGKKGLLDNQRTRLALAILLSIFCWVMVTMVVQPNTTQYFSSVPVNFTYDSSKYTSQGLSIVNDPEYSVSLKVYGNGSVIGGLTRDDFVVYPDYSSVKASGEAYFPSLPKIPVLCRALDNTILLDWLHAQLEEADPHQEVRSCTTLLKRVTKLGGDFGGICNSVDAAIKDNILTGDEAQHICGALYEVEAHARGLRDGLVKISGQKFVPGKGFVRMEMEETPDGSLKSVREVAHQ